MAGACLENRRDTVQARVGDDCGKRARMPERLRSERVCHAPRPECRSGGRNTEFPNCPSNTLCGLERPDLPVGWLRSEN